MFWPERQQLRVFAHLAPVDMRKQRHGLAALAQNVIAESLQRGAVYFYRQSTRQAEDPVLAPEWFCT